MTGEELRLTSLLLGTRSKDMNRSKDTVHELELQSNRTTITHPCDSLTPHNPHLAVQRATSTCLGWTSQPRNISYITPSTHNKPQGRPTYQCEQQLPISYKSSGGLFQRDIQLMIGLCVKTRRLPKLHKGVLHLQEHLCQGRQCDWRWKLGK